MLDSVALKTLTAMRRALLWWSAGLAGIVALMVAVYPSIRDNPSLDKLIEDYPEAMKGFIAFGGTVDYTSAAGYLGSELFSFMLPLLLIVAAVGAGARAIAGEEESGTLDLLLANPLSRRRLVVEKFAALVGELAVLALVLWLSLVVGTRAFGMEVTVANLAAATVSATLLALGYGAIALLVGAATGRRAVAVGLSAAAAVLAYLVNSLAPLVGILESIQEATPFYHYAASDPLRRGLDLAHFGALVAVCLFATALAPFAFERRDIDA